VTDVLNDERIDQGAPLAMGPWDVRVLVEREPFPEGR
jgi:hypothetical protein